MEYISVEHHQQNDDHVEENSNVLNSAKNYIYIYIQLLLLYIINFEITDVMALQYKSVIYYKDYKSSCPTHRLTGTDLYGHNLHEQHELDDWSSSQKFTEGVDKQVIGQKDELDQQYQRVVTSLQHHHQKGFKTLI